MLQRGYIILIIGYTILILGIVISAFWAGSFASCGVATVYRDAIAISPRFAAFEQFSMNL